MEIRAPSVESADRSYTGSDRLSHNRRLCSCQASCSSDSRVSGAKRQCRLAIVDAVEWRVSRHRIHISPTVSHPLLLLIDLQPGTIASVSSADQIIAVQRTALASGRLLPHKAYSSEAARKTHCSQATDSHSAAQETLLIRDNSFIDFTSVPARYVS